MASATTSSASPDTTIQQLTSALKSMKEGDFSVRLSSSTSSDKDQQALFELFNDCAFRNDTLARELERVVADVGMSLRCLIVLFFKSEFYLFILFFLYVTVLCIWLERTYLAVVTNKVRDKTPPTNHFAGREGNLHTKGDFKYEGSWGGCMSSVNSLIEDLVQPTADVMGVIEAVSLGMDSPINCSSLTSNL